MNFQVSKNLNYQIFSIRIWRVIGSIDLRSNLPRLSFLGQLFGFFTLDVWSGFDIVAFVRGGIGDSVELLNSDGRTTRFRASPCCNCCFRPSSSFRLKEKKNYWEITTKINNFTSNIEENQKTKAWVSAFTHISHFLPNFWTSKITEKKGLLIIRIVTASTKSCTLTIWTENKHFLTG